MGKRIAVGLTLVLLLLLFWLPGKALREVAEALVPAAQQAMDAAHAEDWPRAVETLEGMNALYGARHEPLMLFLQHSDLLEIEVALRAGLQLARTQDAGQFLMEMEHVTALLNHLKQLEGFDAYTLF